jgi:hypothetical protein
VESTIGKYRRVKDGLVDEPELIHIFEPFRRGSDYAPEAFVELILRCMLYKADKTFYAPFETKYPTPEEIDSTPFFEDPRSKAITNVLAYIDRDLDYRNNGFALENPLVTLKPPKPPSTRVDRLETIINRLQEPGYDWRLRLAEGAYYYEKLAALVQDRTKAPDSPFLYQMLPAGIRYLPQNEQSPFQFAYSAYSSQRDYENDLIVGDMDKILRTVTHPFVPDQIAFARREVLLRKAPSRPSGETPTGERCSLSFLDAATNCQTKVGDWIVRRTLDDERHLWKIVKALDGGARDHIVVRPVADSPRPLFEGVQGQQIEAVYYSRIVPAKYYLDVLALYLLNLYVANSPVTTNDREKIDAQRMGGQIDPNPVDQPKIWGGISQFVTSSRRFFDGRGKNGLREIFDLVANIYVSLTCHELGSSYYGRAAGDRERDVSPGEFLLDVLNDAKALRNMVEEFLLLPRNTFESERPSLRRIKNVGEPAERDFAALQAEPLDFKQVLAEVRGGSYV